PNAESCACSGTSLLLSSVSGCCSTVINLLTMSLTLSPEPIPGDDIPDMDGLQRPQAMIGPRPCRRERLQGPGSGRKCNGAASRQAAEEAGVRASNRSIAHGGEAARERASAAASGSLVQQHSFQPLQHARELDHFFGGNLPDDLLGLEVH